MTQETQEHREAWATVPAEVQHVMSGGYGPLKDGMRLFDDRGQARAEAQARGHVVRPCLMVLTEEGDRVLLFFDSFVEKGWEPDTYRASVMETSAALMASKPAIKIARAFWEVRPPE